jgi:hypothetical protein
MAEHPFWLAILIGGSSPLLILVGGSVNDAMLGVAVLFPYALVVSFMLRLARRRRDKGAP